MLSFIETSKNKCTSVHAIQGETAKVCHLHLAIYNLKHSPHVYFATFDQLILALGLSACKFDHIIFCKNTSTGSVILEIYVDDILITSS